MRLYAAVKIDRSTYKHLELHKVTVPDFKDPGFYRSVMSLSAFAHNGDDKKNKGCWSPAHLYVVKRWDDFAGSNALVAKRFPDLDDTRLPTFEHASIWAFYLHEGYDYKRQKWATPPGKCYTGT